MGQFFIVLAGALVLGAVVFGVAVLIVGGDQGLEPAEPDGRAVPLPAARPLTESDLGQLRFDVAFRGYRMAQVDQAVRRSAYDLGYKEELIGVLEAEVEALREGRLEEADKLREARLAAARPRAGGGTDADADGLADPRSGANLQDADLGDADLGDADLGDADLGDAADDADDDADTDRDAGSDAGSGDAAGTDAGLRDAVRDERADRGTGSAIDLGMVSGAAAEPAK
jgi:DivIVA domain-containing protein